MNKTDELIRITKNLFSLNLIVILYITLTILSISDSQIILNGTVGLPVFNVEIKLIPFFVLSPITLLILFIYFLVNFKKTLESYIEIPPETNTWLILEPFYSKNYIKPENSKFFSVLEKLVSFFAIWWILPLVNLVILYRSVYTHEDILIFSIGIIETISNFLFLSAYYTIVIKVDKKFREFIPTLLFTLVIGLIYIIFYQPYLKHILVKLNINLLLVYLAIIIIGIFIGIVYWHFKKEENRYKMFQSVWTFILITPFLLCIHYVLLTQVGEKKNISLNGLVLNDNINVKIDLRGKKLDGADLTGVTLINAILKGADLRQTSLSYANLDGSDFEKALLDSATFKRASMLNIKNLTLEQLSKVKTLYEAKFDSTMDSIISKLRTEKLYLFKEPED